MFWEKGTTVVFKRALVVTNAHHNFASLTIPNVTTGVIRFSAKSDYVIGRYAVVLNLDVPFPVVVFCKHADIKPME